MNKAQMHPVKTNSNNGSYRPKFFDLEEFNLSEAKLDSVSYSDKSINPELVIIKKDYSFCYLREDKLKLINVFDERGIRIDNEKFLNRFGIEIQSGNLFKSGKYLSRIFRPVRYGGFFHGVDVFIQKSKTIDVTDGISLISLQLAKSLGWEEAKHGSSGQFTLFNKQGLVKGHCVVSDRIKHDVIIYSNDNIKTEIRFNYKDNLSYLSIEPVKLSRTLRLDIQSMLNLWGLFGAEQYLSWTHKAIMHYKEDLLNGKINDWLKEDDDSMDSEGERWVLKKAINAGLDYRQFPYLFRKAWSIFRNSIYNFTENNKNEPIFRIPVPNGIRAYIRIDLRNHKPNGYFKSRLSKDEIYIDRFGNAYFSEEGFQKKMKILGGADQDDSLAIIPLEDDKAVIYRNPNQFGEFLIVNIKYDKEIEPIVNRTGRAKQVGRVPIKKIKKEPKPNSNSTNHNPLIRNYLKSLPREEDTRLEYTTLILLKSFSRIIKNTANIGYASNAEMILSAIRISNKKVFNELRNEYAWNLEKIIDGTVKEGTDLTDEILKVKSLFETATNKYYNLIPKSLHHRLPDKLRKEDNQSTNHKLDFLLEAIKFITEQMDLELMGKGTISQGNRIQGMIDRLNIPIERIIIEDEYNPYCSVAMGLLQEYNMSIADALKLEEGLEYIPEIKKQYITRLNQFPRQIRKQIIQAIAVQIYKSHKSVHDSILWINDIDELEGTASMTMELFDSKKVNEYTVEEVTNDNRILTNVKNLIIEEIPNNLASQLNAKGSTCNYMDNNYNDSKDIRLFNVAERNQCGNNNLVASLKGIKGTEEYGKHDDINKCDQIIKLRLWSKEKLIAEGLSSTYVRIEGSKAYMDDMIINVGDEYHGILSNGTYNIMKIMQSRSKRHYGRKLTNSIDVIINI